ncbi:MAG: methionine--tRNA ligase [Holophagaceae bacterium]|uniref:Methionine--tRNA ligase n=1 Tax=Candidatus Geothrix skivensis TaxID=2954439 RepID=A0A9D7SGE0_9BACT|nr:methionine--tRNA ligase [Candidatus Geothrix skivensis]
MSKPFYVTTPIYYVNDRPHIGHTYTTVLADVIARFHRMRGEQVFFLTGTDEHGQKVEKAAAARGITPKQLADEVVANYTELWKQMGMTHFRFIRTTDQDHRDQVQRLFKRLVEKGDIYKATYKGLYSVSDEAYVTETQAKELQAQGLAHQLIELEEETYFFRLSAYQDRLLKLYEEHPEFVQPDFRFNEVKRFVEGGLQDLSISRTSISWGIPVPGDEKHVIYVWFDALLNYLTGCPANAWPPDLQIVGKDILRFHAVYWPAFLMAAGMFQPTTILAHGWWLMGDDKMSKSKGNVVRPDTLLRFGNDALRFYFMRDMQVGHDRAFSYEGFIDRLNADLANGLGNLASRTLSMIQRYRGGVVPMPTVLDGLDQEMATQLLAVFPEYLEQARASNFHGALDALWTYLRTLDGYIVKAEPWKLAKDPANDPKLDAVLAILYRALRATALLVAPVMPELAQALWESLGHATQVAETTFHGFALDGPAIGPIGESKPLFQRIDKEKELNELLPPEAPAEVQPSLDVPAIRETVEADTFFKVDLRVGRILEAERVPKSDKLIRMKVDIGLEQRTIVGGIGKAYEPADLLERLVVVVANLAPRKLMGIESHGMLLAASDNASKPYLIAPPADALPGFLVK